MPAGLFRQRLVPDLQPPGLFRLQIDRLIGGAIEIDFKTGMVNDDPVRQSGDHLAGKGILLSQPLFRRKSHQIGYIHADEMTVMDGRADNGRIAEIDRPEAPVFVVTPVFAVTLCGCHAASLHRG
ncbi:hypothetical protein D3C78_1224660 [compost metagenome]